jgi:MAF protein
VTLVLASTSPRRRELLAAAGLEFEVVASGVDEAALIASRPVLLARRLARAKALDVAARRPNDAVLAADTIVVHGGVVLGKPADGEEARSMLTRLRGRTHRVVTAVAVVAPGERTRVEHVVTRVRMRRYGDDEVEASIARGDPFDKAGAYAIQDPLLRPVAAYDGCYCNVVGLPLRTALRLLRDGMPGLEHAPLPAVCEACPCQV